MASFRSDGLGDRSTSVRSTNGSTPPPVEVVGEGRIKIGERYFRVSLTLSDGNAAQLESAELQAITNYAARILNAYPDISSSTPTRIITGDRPAVEFQGPSLDAGRVTRELPREVRETAESLNQVVQTCLHRLHDSPSHPMTRGPTAAAELNAPTSHITLREDSGMPEGVPRDIDDPPVRALEEPGRDVHSALLTGLPDNYSSRALRQRLDNAERNAGALMAAIDLQAAKLPELQEGEFSEAQRDLISDWVDDNEDGLPAIARRYQERVEAARSELEAHIPSVETLQDMTDAQIKRLLKGKSFLGFTLEKGLKARIAQYEKQLASALHEAEKEVAIGLAHQLHEGIPPDALHNAANHRPFADQQAKEVYGEACRLLMRQYELAKQDYLALRQERDDLTDADSSRFLVGNCRNNVHVFAVADERVILKRPMYEASRGFFQTRASAEQAYLKKQLNAVAGGLLSHGTRRPIQREMDFVDHTFRSGVMPLNGHFDDHCVVLAGERHFATIVGEEKGVSSAETAVPHLKNGIQTDLFIAGDDDDEEDLSYGDGECAFRAIRHGVLGRTEPERQARELLEAAVMQELRDRLELGLGELGDDPLAIDLLSVSLISPDIFERVVKSGQKNEHRLWNEQLQALLALQNLDSVTIAGREIPIRVRVVPFNFGVNAGAVDINWGQSEQWTNNEGQREVLNRILTPFVGVAGELPDDHPLKEEFTAIEREIRHLNDDIQHLLRDKASYLEGANGGNQYEVGCRQLVLAHRLTSYRNRMLRAQQDGNLSADFNVPPSVRGLFNCMSGKDRTGVMDAMAKALTIMAVRRRAEGIAPTWPTHAALETDRNLKFEFARTLIQVMAEGGGLDVTEWNTGARGYKVSKHFMPWHKDDALWTQVFQSFGPDEENPAVLAGLLGLGVTVGS